MSDGSTSAGGGVCDTKPWNQPAPRGQTPLTHDITDFLNFCRIEKGLAANSLEAYGRDLQRYGVYFKSQNGNHLTINHTDTVLSYLNSLYRSGLGSRSIARHLLADVRDVVSRLRDDEPVDFGAALQSLRDVITVPALHLDVREQWSRTRRETAAPPLGNSERARYIAGI